MDRDDEAGISGFIRGSGTVSGKRDRLIAVATAPDSVRELVIFAWQDSVREDLAGGAGGRLLDSYASRPRHLRIEGPAHDIDGIDLILDRAGGIGHDAHITSRLLASLATGTKLLGTLRGIAPLHGCRLDRARAADGAGLEEMFLELTAQTSRDETAPEGAAA